jgi:hypothetical protein
MSKPEQSLQGAIANLPLAIPSLTADSKNTSIHRRDYDELENPDKGGTIHHVALRNQLLE